MKPDAMTQSMASIGLLNGTVRILPAGNTGRPVFECNGQRAYFQDPYFEKSSGKKLSQAHVLEYLPKARFQDVRDGVAETLSEMSLKAPELYDGILGAIRAAGANCYAVASPANGVWPYPMDSVWPELEKDETFAHAPYARLFQCAQMADLMSVDGNGLEDPGAWCAENPGALSRTGPYENGAYRYEGLKPDGNGTAVFWAYPVDVSKPWAVASNPDGSEDVTVAVRPMALVSSLLNLWSDASPGMGWFVAELATGKPMELYRFPDEQGAHMFVALQFESAMDDLNARGVKDIDPASGIGLENGRNILVWSEPGARGSSSIQWHVHEGYEGFGLK